MTAAGVIFCAPFSHASQDFTDIDQHALNAPGGVEQSIPTLAAYLSKYARNDTEKARAAYRWIADRIAYGAQSHAGQGSSESPAANTLIARSAICSGYADLFEKLGVAMGLKVAVISGNAKGLGYTVGSPLTSACSHQWNAVQIDGQWRLVDCAWGAGHIGLGGAYSKDLDEHFFFTAPEEFIYHHFPTEPKWQLLSKPVTVDEFLKMPQLRSAFFTNGLKVVSHKQAAIAAQGSVSVTISAPQDVLLTAKLTRSGRSTQSLAIAQREDDDYRIYAVLPEPGDYVLQIYAKKADGTNEYTIAADYLVKATEGAGKGVVFPEAFSAFSERNGRIYYPMAGRLKPGALYPFQIKAPGASEVAVIDGSDWVFLTKKDDLFEGRITAGTGAMKVAAKYSGQKEYSVLLEYQADPDASLNSSALAFTSTAH